MKIPIFPLLLLLWGAQAFRIASEKECLPVDVDPKAPKCELHVEAADEEVNVSCHQNQVIQIVGDYNVLRINCTATYPMDFQFDGIIPTEAIQVHSWRALNKSSSAGLEIESFHFDVKVLSISALYEHFKTKTSSNETELRDDFKYSRTGEYQLKGLGKDAMTATSFYIFLEEPLAKLDFIENNRTFWHKEKSKIHLPCRPTHYMSNVTVNANPSEIETYDARRGFIVQSNAIMRTFTCESSLRGEVARITFDTTRTTRQIPFGFLKPLSNQDVTIAFPSNNEFKNGGNRSSIYSVCVITQQIPRSYALNMIGAPSYVELGLTSDFVLPAFVNRSYGVDVGRRSADSSFQFQLLRTNGTTMRAGVSFCGNELVYDVKMYEASLTGSILSFPFHKDMCSLTRKTSNIALYMKIDLKRLNASIHDGDVVELTCQVLRTILVPPVVWFVRFTNGSERRVYVDYNLDDETSSFKLKAAMNMSQIICTASMWQMDFWRNISHDITVLKTEAGIVTTGSSPESSTVLSVPNPKESASVADKGNTNAGTLMSSRFPSSNIQPWVVVSILWLPVALCLSP